MAKINFPTLLLSGLVSVGLWLYVFGQRTNPTKTQTLNLRLNTVSIDQTKFVVTDAPDTISASIAGTSKQISDMAARETAGIVDLANATPGTRTYPVTIFPTALRELMVSTALTAQVKVEKLESRMVAVTVMLTRGRVPNNFEVDVLPIKLRVAGTKDALSKVVSLQAVVEPTGDATLANGTIVEVKALDSAGRPVTKVVLSDLSEAMVYSPELLLRPQSVRVRLKTPTSLVPTP